MHGQQNIKIPYILRKTQHIREITLICSESPYKYSKSPCICSETHYIYSKSPLFTPNHPTSSKSLCIYSESPYRYSKSPCIHSEQPDTEKSGTSARHAKSTDFPLPTHNEFHTAGRLLEKLTGPHLFTNLSNFMQPVSSLLRS